MNAKPASQAASAFSLITGGPLFQLYLRVGLVRSPFRSVKRVMLTAVLVTWLPLLILATLDGGGASTSVPFLYDIETHARFLLALPILIAAEVVVHRRLRVTVGQFIDRGIIVPDDVASFNAAVQSTIRLRDAPVIEIALLVIVYTIGHYVWRQDFATSSPSWYGAAEGSAGPLTPAGYWLAFVSIPLWQFLLLRWYLRLILWFLFLWRVSRLRLRLISTHPDKAGGLGFVGNSAYAFGSILFAQGVTIAGLIATQVFHQGKDLMTFKMDVAGFIVFQLLFVLGPLTMFTPHLMRAKGQGGREYGRLANRYVEEFDRKWIRGEDTGGDVLLGNSDIQSLADLASSYAVIGTMRRLPFTTTVAIELALVTIAPLLPVLLAVLPLEPVVDRLIRVLF